MPEEEMTPEEKYEKQQEVQSGQWLRVQELGEVAGLHPEFIRDVQERGQTAIIDRADSVDRTGVHAMILGMSQEYGAWMQEYALSQNSSPSVDEKVDVMSKISRRYGVEPDTGIFLLGTIDEHLDAASGALRRDDIGQTIANREENEDGRTRPETL